MLLLSYLIHSAPALCYQCIMSAITVGTAAETQLTPQMQISPYIFCGATSGYMRGARWSTSGHLCDYLRDRLPTFICSTEGSLLYTVQLGPLTLSWVKIPAHWPCNTKYTIKLLCAVFNEGVDLKKVKSAITLEEIGNMGIVCFVQFMTLTDTNLTFFSVMFQQCR